MKKSIIISLMAFFSFTIGNAGNVQIQNVSMEPGKTVDVNISLSSAANQYIGVQFDFTLPEGFPSLPVFRSRVRTASLRPR